MDGLLQWETGDGPVVVEVDSRDPGFQSVGRTSGDELITVNQPFGEALDRVRGAAVTALRTFRDESLAPDEVSLEFGVKFNATAGAVIAKTSAEGHLIVRLAWLSRPQANTGNGTSAE
ncbi:MAG: CU044_2847 family protein [Streptosporangiaceae bacterium]